MINVLRPWQEWSLKTKTKVSFDASTPTTHVTLHIPVEVWIEVVHHLRHDSYPLRQLSLVSQTLRTIAQKVLFQRINLIRTRPEPLYRKFCQCGKPNHRHVLKHIREFSILISNETNFTTPTPFTSNKSPATLIQHMTNLEYLTISIDVSSRKAISPLWTLPLDLKGLFLHYKGPFSEPDKLNIIQFLSNQPHLKQLAITIHGESPKSIITLPPPPPPPPPPPHLPDLKEFKFPQIDFLSLDLHNSVLVDAKIPFKGVYINPNSGGRNDTSLVTQEERLETKLRLETDDVHSAFISFDHLKQLNLNIENMEFLWLPYQTPHTIDRFISKFHNLKFLILEPRYKAYELYKHRLAFIRKLFVSMPHLEKIGFSDLVLKVWTRGVGRDGEVWERGRDERVDFYLRCQEFQRLSDSEYCLP